MLALINYSDYILKDINLTIDSNLIVLGSNGSGKTTLVKTISQNNLDKDVNYIPSILDIFDENLKVVDFLELSLVNNCMSIDEVLSILNIKYLKNSYCKDLSSGENNLLQIASALLHNAKYSFFDEPTANLDPIRTRLVFNVLKNYFNIKIVVTHNIDFAYKLGYNILFLKNGKIEFFGRNSEFFSKNMINKFYGDSLYIKDNNVIFNFKG